MPSCLRVRERAAKRLSWAARRVTKDAKKYREERKEAVLPRIVAIATMSQLW